MTRQSFQQQLQELEDIVEWFNSDDVDLDQAVEKFERAGELVTVLQSRLSEAETKITEIQQTFPDGSPDSEDPDEAGLKDSEG